jgi:hypothetical protein
MTESKGENRLLHMLVSFGSHKHVITSFIIHYLDWQAARVWGPLSPGSILERRTYSLSLTTQERAATLYLAYLGEGS